MPLVPRVFPPLRPWRPWRESACLLKPAHAFLRKGREGRKAEGKKPMPLGPKGLSFFAALAALA